MANDIFYVEHNEDVSMNFIKKIYNSIIFRYKILDFEENKHLIIVNRKNIDKRALKELIRIVKGNIFLCSSNVKMKSKLSGQSLNGKSILKKMVVELMCFISENTGIDYRQEGVFIAIKDDKNENIITDLGKIFKSINIVTDVTKKLRRLDNRLQKNDDIVYSISSNRKKALKRARILINFDYGNEFFYNFNINRYCIIINLNSNELTLKNSFQGSIIERISVLYNDKYQEIIDNDKYEKTLLYESFIYYSSYNEAKNMILEDMCQIDKLYGMHCEIDISELKNNYQNSGIKLDK